MAGYKRSHLRAPCFTTILFADGGYIFKAATLNISVGGMLVKDLPTFPEGDQVPLMLRLPQFPSLINFNLEKLRSYSPELFPAKIVRTKGQMVRKASGMSAVDELFVSNIGLHFTTINKEDQKIISDYVTVFASNILHLQSTLESVNSNHDSLEKSRLLAGILGYESNLKISQMRNEIARDYQSLSIL
ncbi:MAG: PilZ domain-containing protein [Bacteriovoracaceae bacterium]